MALCETRMKLLHMMSYFVIEIGFPISSDHFCLLTNLSKDDATYEQIHITEENIMNVSEY